MKSKVIALLACSVILGGCATGSTPAAKKKNAIAETNNALQKIYEEHSGAKAAVDRSKAYLVCTGSDSYLFVGATGGGVCTYHKNGNTTFYRFASLGAGAGIGLKKVAFVYAYQRAEAMRRFETEGWDAGARAEASVEHDDEGEQVAANTSFDIEGVKIYQSAIWGAAVQATVQGYSFWETDFTDDVIQNPE